MVPDSFTKRLRAYRKLKHLTQAEFAAALGVSVAIIGGLERGTRNPTETQLQKIEEILVVSRQDLGFVPSSTTLWRGGKSVHADYNER